MSQNFLETIIEHKKCIVSKAKQCVSQQELQQTIASRTQTTRPFTKRLATPGPSGINIIAEIKRASPSKGAINIDLDPVVFAQKYEAGGAAAISVLTEDAFFKGSLDDLKAARDTVSIPVLRKDFLISSYQIYESAAFGVDAVLLIVRILEKQQLKDYLDLCRELRLDALVEINSEPEVEHAAWAGAKLIGINNRNLKSFETDIETAIRLKSLLTPEQIAVAASGISQPADISKNKAFGLTNFLIGESLVRAKNPQIFLKELHNA